MHVRDQTRRAARIDGDQVRAPGLVGPDADEHLADVLAAEEPGERPLASPLARLKAESDARITNLCLRHVEVSDFDRLVLRLLDGDHDRGAIVESLQEAVTNDTFTIQRGDEPVRDPEQVRDVLGEGVEASLERMARLALFPREIEEKAR